MGGWHMVFAQCTNKGFESVLSANIQAKWRQKVMEKERKKVPRSERPCAFLADRMGESKRVLVLKPLLAFFSKLPSQSSSTKESLVCHCGSAGAYNFPFHFGVSVCE